MLLARLPLLHHYCMQSSSSFCLSKHERPPAKLAGALLTAQWVACSLLEGKSGVEPIDRFDASTFPTTFAAQIKGFSAEGCASFCRGSQQAASHCAVANWCSVIISFRCKLSCCLAAAVSRPQATALPTIDLSGRFTLASAAICELLQADRPEERAAVR